MRSINTSMLKGLGYIIVRSNSKSFYFIYRLVCQQYKRYILRNVCRFSPTAQLITIHLGINKSLMTRSGNKLEQSSKLPAHLQPIERRSINRKLSFMKVTKSSQHHLQSELPVSSSQPQMYLLHFIVFGYLKSHRIFFSSLSREA